MEYKILTCVNKEKKAFDIYSDFVCLGFQNINMPVNDFLIFSRNIDGVLHQIIKNGEKLGLKNKWHKQSVMIVCLKELQEHPIEIKNFEVFTKWLSKTYMNYFHEYEEEIMKNNRETKPAFYMAQFSTRQKLEDILEN